MMIIRGPGKCLLEKCSKQNMVYNDLENMKGWIL